MRLQLGAKHQKCAQGCAVRDAGIALDSQLTPPGTQRHVMALKPPPPPWEVLQQVGDLVGASRGEVDKGMRSLVQSALSRLALVSREDFDAQSEILQRTRARVAALESAVEELTRELERLERGR
jgi:BMFP domain-containing protein YqiC